MVHYRGGRAAIDREVYPDLDAFWGDLRGVRGGVGGSASSAARYLQLDDTRLAYLNDPACSISTSSGSAATRGIGTRNTSGT